MYGLDLSPYFIGVAQERTNVHNKPIKYIHGNAECLPFDDNSIQMITFNFIFHELPELASYNILQEAYRVLEPNGIIVLVDIDKSHLDETLKNNVFRRWAFEATEPHIYDYYKRDNELSIKNVGYKNVIKIKNDPLNTIWFGQKKQYDLNYGLSYKFDSEMKQLPRFLTI